MRRGCLVSSNSFFFYRRETHLLLDTKEQWRIIKEAFRGSEGFAFGTRKSHYRNHTYNNLVKRMMFYNVSTFSRMSLVRVKFVSAPWPVVKTSLNQPAVLYSICTLHLALFSRSMSGPRMCLDCLKPRQPPWTMGIQISGTCLRTRPPVLYKNVWKLDP